MPDTNHVDSCPHTAVDNTLVIRMVCARSDGVLSGSWVHVPRPPRFHTRVFQPFRSRFPSRDLYGCHPYHRRGKKPRSRTADQIRPVWFHRSLYYRSVPIFRTNLSRYARRITMAMAIAAPPPIWCIPTLSIAAQCFVLIPKDSSGDLIHSVHCSVWNMCHVFHAVFDVYHAHVITITELNALHVVYYFSVSVDKCIYFHNCMLLK